MNTTPSDAEEDCGPLTLVGDCRCRNAVERTYGGMLRSGVSSKNALEAAIRVYRFHHPKVSLADAGEVVQIWLHDGQVH